MHVTLEYIVVKRPIFDTNKEHEIKNAEDAIRVIDEAIKKMKDVAKEYEDEYQVIQDVASKFAYLLTNHSTTVKTLIKFRLLDS